MSGTVIGQALAVVGALLVGGVTGAYALRNRKVEVSAPDRIAEAFTNLVKGLSEEIERLRVLQAAQEIRIKDLEKRSSDDEATIGGLETTIASLGRQIDWLLSRLRSEDIAEFEAIFRPHK